MTASANRYFRILALAIAGLMLSLSASALGEDVNPEVSEDIRIKSAQEKLAATPSIVVLYAEGLCCPSCAIGVRKKVSRLSFVDRKRFNNGVDLDAKTQLVSVAVTASLDESGIASLSQSVWDAGYTPVRSYTMAGDEVISTPLPGENTK
ncbi:MAG: heavy-metal-associated domain-containing protein [Opitutaceae bacterium]|jgi:copper chaperone CopZ|nr:heavy-metal-associated domain-containing protein [Opitutaceae bacterium]